MLIGPTLAKNIPDMFAAAQDGLPQQISHFIIAIDAAKLSVDGKNTRTQEFEEHVKLTGGRLPGSNRVNPESLNSADEITITDQTLEQLKSWSAKLGIA
jgi:(2R)-3-sulfolactate dehydrogenase (NADP+)